MEEIDNTDFVDAYIAKMGSGITWDEFFDELKVPKEQRSNFLCSAIINGAKKKSGLPYLKENPISKKLNNVMDEMKDNMGMQNEKDIGYPCQVCNMLEECKAKDKDNLCGCFKALDKFKFVSQQVKWFIFKNPIRRWIFKRQRKHLKVNKTKYEQLTGEKWMFDTDPFPDWTLKNP